MTFASRYASKLIKITGKQKRKKAKKKKKHYGKPLKGWNRLENLIENN